MNPQHVWVFLFTQEISCNAVYCLFLRCSMCVSAFSRKASSVVSISSGLSSNPFHLTFTFSSRSISLKTQLSKYDAALPHFFLSSIHQMNRLSVECLCQTITSPHSVPISHCTSAIRLGDTTLAGLSDTHQPYKKGYNNNGDYIFFFLSITGRQIF